MEDEKALKRVLNFLRKKRIKVKEVQTSYHEEGPIAYIYVPSSKFPLNRRGFIKLSQLEAEIRKKLNPKIKLVFIVS